MSVHTDGPGMDDEHGYEFVQLGSHTVNERDLHAVVRLVGELLGEVGDEGGEAEIERDPALLALRVLVECRRRTGRAERT